jgi:steroid 5-alpha reductase family enzyme
MTTGLWAWSMHVNYLGDSLLFIGWTLAAGGAWWTWFVPTVVTTLFLTMHIPNLDEYLLHRYPHEFPAYAAKTSKFMPCIY